MTKVMKKPRIKSNAKTDTESSLLSRYVTATEEGGQQGELLFGKGGKVKIVDDKGLPTILKLEEFINYLNTIEESGRARDNTLDIRDGLPSTDTQVRDLVGLGVSRLAAERMTKDEADKALADLREQDSDSNTVERVVENERLESATDEGISVSATKLDALRRRLVAQVDSLVNNSMKERSGELNRNSYRLTKGADLCELEDIAKEMHRMGDETAKDYISFIRSEYQERMLDKGVVDSGKRLNPTEITMTRKAYRSWCKGRQGLATNFNYIDEVNPATGQPLVSDSGKPFTYPISNIATNQLYHLADFVDNKNLDRLASIAMRYSEAMCVKIAKALKRHEDKANVYINAIATKRMETSYSGRTVKVNMDEPTLNAYLDKLLGNDEKPEIATILVDKAFYHGAYENVRNVATDLYKKNGLPLDKDGNIPNTVLMERVFGYFLNQPGSIAAVLYDAGDITKEQAAQYIPNLDA